MGKKSSGTAVSHISSASAPAVTTANSANKSSILKSSFAPSTLQLHLFASVIQSFDSQQLRIHDTNNGRLRQQHSASPGTTITSLDWGYYGASIRESSQSAKKKRKRIQPAAEGAVVAYGTSDSNICMYSPAEGRIVGQLVGGHNRGIKDFRFSQENTSDGWSVGGDGRLVQWNLHNDQPVRTISLPDSSVNILGTPSNTTPQILCASTSPFSIDFSSSEDFRIDTFDSFKNEVTSLIRAGTHDSTTFLAADNDRYINIFDSQRKKLTKTLVVGSDVSHIDLHTIPTGKENAAHHQILAVVTKDGTIELFSEPFIQPITVNGDLKSKRRSLTKKANAQIRLLQQDNRKLISVFTAAFQDADLVVVSVDGGVEPVFQRVRWQDEGTGKLMFDGTKDIFRNKSISTLGAAVMNGVKDLGKTHVDESRTIVVNGDGELGSQAAAIEISSEEEEENDETDIENDSEILEAGHENGAAADDSDEEMEDADASMEEADTTAKSDGDGEDVLEQEPSFGDLLASKHPDTITIADAFAPDQSTFDINSKQLALPVGMSLGTVLTQALRTNDLNLLESCLHANDTGIIQNTIQRLDSGLASVLLSKLAERLASRPGRYGHLLSWVQWTCIAHGGAIAAQPDVAAKIRTLYRVLNQRSKSFEKLLLLKGKLDMLDAQLTFRKQLQEQRGGPRDDQDEPGMIYIEGEADNWSSEDDHDEAIGSSTRLGFKTKRPLQKDFAGLVDDQDSSDEDEEDMPLTNGIATQDSEEEEEDSESDSNNQKPGGLIDIEAEVSGENNSSEEEGEGDDIDSEEEEEEDDDEDEEDSEMDSFINDGSVGVVSDEDDIDIDEDDTPQKPATKKSKHR